MRVNLNKYLDKNEWVDKVGYCRALKKGNMIFISGTVSNDENGNPIAIGDATKQTDVILSKFVDIMEYFDSSIEDIVRTRIYVTNIDDWETIGTVHGKYFKDIKPTTSMVEVSKLISPDYLVEIEAMAVVG